MLYNINIQFEANNRLTFNDFLLDASTFLYKVDKEIEEKIYEEIRWDLMREMLDVMVNSQYYLNLLPEFQAAIINRWQKLCVLLDLLYDYRKADYTEETTALKTHLEKALIKR